MKIDKYCILLPTVYSRGSEENQKNYALISSDWETMNMETDLQGPEYHPIKIFWIIDLKTVYTLYKYLLYTMKYNVDIVILKNIKFNVIYVYCVIYNLWMTSSWSIVQNK